MDMVDCIVVGAGAVGLAIARRLSRDGKTALVLDSAPTFGSETSARNSEVIHAGIYYVPGSLKSRFCIAGRQLLYSYAQQRGIPHRRTEKLIVATSPHQLEKLADIHARAARCGVPLHLLSEQQAKALEPALNCLAALLSPTTGIIDSHAYMQSLVADIETAGGIIAYNTFVRSAAIGGDTVVVQTGSPGLSDEYEVGCRVLINAAGLAAQRLASSIAGFPPDWVPPRYLAKGNYFAASCRSPFSRMIYPAPEDGGLGIHLTFDLSGGIRFGPDVEWTDRVDYAVDAGRSASFYGAIRQYWPDLPDGCLHPDYAGIRPKLNSKGEVAADFRIDGPSDHKGGPVINLFGIESPGLTASLAIADHVAGMVRDHDV